MLMHLDEEAIMDKTKRPKVVGALIVKTVTGCGNLYVQLGWWNGKLNEVFATLGKSGGCAMSFNEALTRSITAGLRFGESVPVSEYVKQLRGIRCPTPMPFPKEDAVMSCPDAIAKVLEEYGSLTAEGMIMLIQRLNAPPSSLSEEEEMKEATKRVEELKAERERESLEYTRTKMVLG